MRGEEGIGKAEQEWWQNTEWAEQGMADYYCSLNNILGECPCVATEIYNHDNLCTNMCYIVM